MQSGTSVPGSGWRIPRQSRQRRLTKSGEQLSAEPRRRFGRAHAARPNALPLPQLTLDSHLPLIEEATSLQLVARGMRMLLLAVRTAILARLRRASATVRIMRRLWMRENDRAWPCPTRPERNERLAAGFLLAQAQAAQHVLVGRAQLAEVALRGNEDGIEHAAPGTR